MTIRRGLVLIAGLVLGLIGLGGEFVPGLLPDIRVVSAGIAAIALVAFALAVALVVTRVRSKKQPLALPMPEGRANAVPGDEIDHRIASLSRTNPYGDEPAKDRESFRARVERAARWILSRNALGMEQARTQLTEGTWTDDPYAAAFFTDTTVGRAVTREVRALLTAESPIAYRAHHAITALVRRLDRESPAAPSSDGAFTSEENGRSFSIRSLLVSAREGRGTSRPQKETKTEEIRDSSELRIPERGETVERRTGRWRGATAVGLLLGATGIVLRRPALLLATVVGVGLAAYARTATPPTVALDIERTVSETHPSIGDDIEITVTVRNMGDTLCPDCTLIDGVPPGLVVMDGSPRHGVALRPGKATTFSYTLGAARGEHRFTPTSVIARDVSGSVERLTRVAATGSTTITCPVGLTPFDAVPLRAHAERFGGRTTTDSAGGGVEFHATRDYQPGDPLSRIDWNRLAKTGDLSTLQFRAERRPTVVVLIDARRGAFLASTPDDRSAVNRSVEVAGRIVGTLLDERIPVGIGALSSQPEQCWLAPNTGDGHRERVQELLTTHAALSPHSSDLSNATPHTVSTSPSETEPEDSDPALAAWLHRRIPTDAQVFVLTPLCDDEISEWIRKLDVSGHPATVLSPDPTVLTSPGRQLASIERAIRITNLRSAGIPVLDWSQSSDESVSAAMRNFKARGESRTMGRRANAGAPR